MKTKQYQDILRQAVVCAVWWFGLLPALLCAQNYEWSNFVGKPGGYGNIDGTGSAARFARPESVTVDGSGNIYVADTVNHTIRKVTSTGVVTTLAGSTRVSGNEDGTGSSARFSSPVGVTVDASGTLYVADGGNHTIRKVTPAGVVTTLAGSAGFSGSEDGTGSAARFSSPRGVAVDASGTLYVADGGNHTIRKVTPAGIVTTLVGSAGNAGSADGDGRAAQFDNPHSVAVDGSGHIYITDNGNSTIRKVSPAGVVTTLAGSAGNRGSANGDGSAARFSSPRGVAVDASGTLYIADAQNNNIRKVSSAGVVTTLVGSAGDWGNEDGAGAAARFDGPSGMTVDTGGTLYVADRGNCTIRKVTPAGVVTTLAGLAGNWGSADGVGSIARFESPRGMAMDASGALYVADSRNHTIRKVSPTRVVTTLAGSAGNPGGEDGTGAAARFDSPYGVAVDASGTLYIADMQNHTIRKVMPDGDVTTLAGRAWVSGTTNGPGSTARFYRPEGLAVDGDGNVYVADTQNHTIRKISPAGVVTTLAGRALRSGSEDGTGAFAQFFSPCGVAVDASGTLYVADTLNHTIRKVTPDGVVTTLAGSAGNQGSTDGVGSTARFYYPCGVVMDDNSHIYVADYGNQMIRKITPDGVVTTIGGMAGILGGSDGIGSAASFISPYSIVVDKNGNVYVVDTGNNRISRGVPGGESLTPAYQQWTNAVGLFGADAEPGAMPFHDGVINLLKYAFNMGASRPDVSRLIPGVGTSGLPFHDVTESAEGHVFRLEYLRRKNAGLTYAPKVSPNLALGSFVPMTGTESSERIDDTWERVRLEQIIDPQADPRRFGMVEVLLEEE